LHCGKASSTDLHCGKASSTSAIHTRMHSFKLSMPWRTVDKEQRLPQLTHRPLPTSRRLSTTSMAALVELALSSQSAIAAQIRAAADPAGAYYAGRPTGPRPLQLRPSSSRGPTQVAEQRPQQLSSSAAGHNSWSLGGAYAAFRPEPAAAAARQRPVRSRQPGRRLHGCGGGGGGGGERRAAALRGPCT
jgi:hypothetical protein